MARYRYVEQNLELIRRSGAWNPRIQRILKAAPLVVFFLLLNARSARSASCSFNPTPDPTVDGSPTSLRHAIQAANASGQDCLITLAKGTYTITIKNTNGHENDAAQGDLDIADSGHTVTIQGQGAASSIVNGNKIDRVFDVLSGADAVFQNLTIEGGIAQDDGTSGALPGTTAALGGGILVQGTGQASLEGVTLKGNLALGGNGAPGGSFLGSRGSSAGSGGAGQPAAGGGLYSSSGSIDLSSSAVSGNAASGGTGGNGGNSGGPPCLLGGSGGPGGTGAGGGLYLSESTKLSASTVSGNSATGGAGGNGGFNCASFKRAGGGAGDGNGGGLFVRGGTLTLSASTVSGNSVTGGNGGNGGVGTASAAAGGGSSRGAGMYVAGGSVSLTNSTLSANAANNGGSGGSGAGGI